MHDADIAGVEPATLESFGGGIRVVVIALGNIIAVHNCLPHCLGIAWHIFHVWIDDAYTFGDCIALSLTSQHFGLLGIGKFIPLFMPFADRIGAVGLRQSINMDGTNVESFQLA